MSVTGFSRRRRELAQKAQQAQEAAQSPVKVEQKPTSKRRSKASDA